MNRPASARLSRSPVIRWNFNGDGSVDLAVVDMGDSRVSVLLNLATRRDYPIGKAQLWLAAADFDRNGTVDLATDTDGRVDLAVANLGADTFSILPGQCP